MKYLILFLMVVISFSVLANSEHEALTKAAEAFSKTETGKTVTKNLERTAENILPMEKDTAAIVGSTALTVIEGKIDTSKIKNMDIEILKGKIRPDAEYDFREKNSSVMLKYNLNW